QFNDAFVAELDASGHALWSRAFASAPGSYGNGVAIDASGSVIVAGDFGGTVDFGGGPVMAASSNDAFVAKYDAGGAYRWSRDFGSASGTATALKIGVDASGNVLLPVIEQGGAVDFGCGA